MQPATIYTYYLFETNSKKKCQKPSAAVYLQILCTLVPIGVIAILNYKLFKIVKEQRQRIVVLQQPPHKQSEQVQSKQNQTWLRRLAIELKAVKTFAIISGVLIFCFAPHIVLSVMEVMSYGCLTIPIGKHMVAINSIVNAYIYALKHRKYSSPWVTGELRRLLFERDSLKKRAVKSGDASPWHQYKQFRNRANNEMKRAKRLYFTNNLELHKHDMKKTWKLINDLNSRHCRTSSYTS